MGAALQLDLLPTTAPSHRRVACSRCGYSRAKALSRGRIACRRCDKDTPAPGTPVWRTWTRGIFWAIDRRCTDAGLWRDVIAAQKAILWDEGEVPEAVAPLLADIMVLPCSHRRYEALLERALNEVGLTMRLREAPRPLRFEPLKVRVEVDDPADEAAEAEAVGVADAEAIDQRARATRGVCP